MLTLRIDRRTNKINIFQMHFFEGALCNHFYVTDEYMVACIYKSPVK